MRTMLTMLFLVFVLTGCEEQKRDIKDTVFAPQVKALEKARAVEDKLKQGAEKNREALKSIEQASGTEEHPSGN